MLLFDDHGITLGHFPPAPANRGQPKYPVFTFEAGALFFGRLFRFLTATMIVVTAGFISVASAQSISCTCRYQGEDYGLGESICLKSPGGMKMATCSMVLNNTSWKLSNAPCPLSQLTPDVVEKGKDTTKLSPAGPAHHLTAPVSPG